MKPREFWIAPDPSNTWRNRPPYEVEGLIHVREVVPIDWAEVWKHFPHLSPDIQRGTEKLVEKQLAGEE